MIDQRMLSRENFSLSDQQTEASSMRNKNPGPPSTSGSTDGLRCISQM